MGCDSTNGIVTAIGCISLSASNPLVDIVSLFLRFGGGIAGGIGIILIIYSGYMIMTSSGDPKKVQAGKELLGAAVSGVIMLIFAVFILRLIGSDTLRIF
ncbi:MAG: hypothetical protein NZM26_04405 [Patescibacteria group bacterium]|nr:hypothetical protein [Patescibacteria group bacterium]